MHPNRRRKKRPNYGIRTVEVSRGIHGFGFTISGQQPCILSCIVTNSPADQAGLKAGDFLISVNGTSVSKSTHDAVVNLIGCCVAPIKMTIAENYYSDSSDEDVDMPRLVNSRKPKYGHKPRVSRPYSKQSDDRPQHHKKVLRNGAQEVRDFEVESAANQAPMEDEGGPIEYKAIVGYLGTIEMPKQLLPNARLQTVCSCIRKLRQEKRIPTAVLMTVLPTCLTLKNSSNHILAIYPTNRVVYISSSTDKDCRYFGLVTSAVSDSRNNNNPDSAPKHYNIWDDVSTTTTTPKPSNQDKPDLDVDISNSCHVFVTDPKLTDHSIHLPKADTFKITCTDDPVTGNCLEFPRNALYIVSLVQSMYHLQNSDVRLPNEDQLVANSPQPSASSNSDSGIGFRDDCGNISDRILVVEFPREFPATRQFPVVVKSSNRPSNVVNIALEGLDLPLNNNGGVLGSFNYGLNNSRLNNIAEMEASTSQCNVSNIRACDSLSIKNVIEKPGDYLIKQNNSEQLLRQVTDLQMAECGGNTNRLTVRAMPPNQPTHSHPSSQSTPFTEPFNERPVDVVYQPNTYDTVSLNDVRNITTTTSNNNNNTTTTTSLHSAKSLDQLLDAHVFKAPQQRAPATAAACCLSTTARAQHYSRRQYTRVNSNSNNGGATLAACSGSNSSSESLVKSGAMTVDDGCKQQQQSAYSCEELSGVTGESWRGRSGSVSDLTQWGSDGRRRQMAQSEPDVRIDRGVAVDGGTAPCEDNGNYKDHLDDPATWSTSFEKLLECPWGLQTFADFLKKEFSAENIYFWTACERFKRLSAGTERTTEAWRIYEQHLCVGAAEAVNVDAPARQHAKQALQEGDASPTIFSHAQKQIFNLMKFDSYTRFLKSDLYNQCLSGNVQKYELESGLLIYQTSTITSKLKKSLSNAEDRRRKSLLPWHRKNRSKSKDRGESDFNQKQSDINENNLPCTNETHNSISSLTSIDLAMHSSNLQDPSKPLSDDQSLSGGVGRNALCRVILSNGSTTVVQIQDSETIQQLINRLLHKRGIIFRHYVVYSDKHDMKAIDISESSMKIAGCEVTVEARVSFKLDLPNGKIIGVKSKCNKKLVDILRPILLKYCFNLDQVICFHDNKFLDVNIPITKIDGARINIQLKEACSKDQNNIATDNSTTKSAADLDVLTNRIYEDILHEKSDTTGQHPKSDKESVKSEDWGSEHSSGIFGKFLRRDSAVHDRKKKLAATRAKCNSSQSSVEDVTASNSTEMTNPLIKKPLIAKWKAGAKLQVACSESDELYEGLSRAQRSRLEDQRGTEINFELPDFLKAKHEHEQINKLRKIRRSDPATNANAMDTGNHSTSSTDGATLPDKPPPPVTHSNTSRTHPTTTTSHSNYENRSILVAAVKQNTASNNQSMTEEGGLRQKTTEVATSRNRLKGGEPPPLPPKPKILPMKPSNWGHHNSGGGGGGATFKVPKEIVRKDCVSPALFLEQPTSSFV